MITIQKQKGVAIITALLIVAIAVTVSTSISTRLQLDVRRTSNLIASDQAALYVQAAEEWTQRILKKDRQDSSIDALTESWAIALPPLPVEGGTVQGTLTDLSACINLNALLDPKSGLIDPLVNERLERLFGILRLKTPPSTQALLDWIDSNQETTTPNGAEDGYYLNLSKPYRTANTELVSLSELRLIKSFEKPEVFAALPPHVCAYSAQLGDSAININTASKEVLQSLSDNMTEQLAEEILNQRAETPFEDLDDFKKFNKLGTIIKNTNQLSVSSNLFLLRTQAVIGQADLVVYSIILRDKSGNSTIIARSQRVL